MTGGDTEGYGWPHDRRSADKHLVEIEERFELRVRDVVRAELERAQKEGGMILSADERAFVATWLKAHRERRAFYRKIAESTIGSILLWAVAGAGYAIYQAIKDDLKGGGK